LRIIFLVIALFFTPVCLAAEPQWYVLITGTGCKPVARLYHLFPYLEGKTTPETLYAAMDAKYSDARLEPYLTAMWRALRLSGEEQSPQDKEFFSHFTRSNAMLLTGNDGRVNIPLVTEELCAELHILPPPAAASAPVPAKSK
jgi:hypothetical protein